MKGFRIGHDAGWRIQRMRGGGGWRWHAYLGAATLTGCTGERADAIERAEAAMIELGRQARADAIERTDTAAPPDEWTVPG